MGYQQSYPSVTVVDANTFATGYRYVSGVLSTVSIPVPFLYGTKLTTGTGVPSVPGIAAGDLYLNILTSDIYQWSGSAWSPNPIMTLVGGSLQIPIWVYGPPVNAEVLYELQASAGFFLPAGLPNSQASADTASTGAAVFTIYKNGSPIGTITFTSSATGVFAFAADVTFAQGDVLKVVAPTTANSTLANIRINLYGAQAGSAIAGTPAAAASAAAAAASAASALTYMTAAGNSATAAGNSQTAAAGSATAAGNSATAASGSASAASGSASSAAASAAAAIVTLSTSLLKANNLSDVANVATARTNLSVQPTFNPVFGTQLTVVDTTATVSLNLQASAGQVRQLVWYTSATPRWAIGVDSSTETGSNAGSNIAFVRFNDAGALIENWLTIARSTGVAAFAHRPTFAGNTPWDNNNLVAPLVAANNLSDVVSAPTARTNLGVGRTLITTIVAAGTAATVDFLGTLITTAFDDYEIEMLGVAGASSGGTLQVRISTNGTSFFATAAYHFIVYNQNFGSPYSPLVSTPATAANVNQTQVSLAFTMPSTANSRRLNGSIRLRNTTAPAISGSGASVTGEYTYQTDAGAFVVGSAAGWWDVAAGTTIQGIQILGLASNITGTFRLYGLNK